MDKVERKRLIKSLLSGRLSKKQRKAFADLESVDIEIKNNGMNLETELLIWQ